MKKKTLWVLGTGGTIAGTLNNPVSKTTSSVKDFDPYTAAQHTIQSLTSHLSGQLAADWELNVQQVMQIDSKDMSWESWGVLIQSVQSAQSQSTDGAILITHGTDTLEETATLLDWWMEHDLGWTQDVTLTCAMRPADHPNADGPANLLQSTHWVTTTHAGRNVWISANGSIWSAEQVQKNHPLDVNAISARSGNSIATWNNASCAWQLNDQGVQQCQTSSIVRASSRTDWDLKARSWPKQAPWVEVIRSGASVDARSLMTLLDNGLQGVILECTGNGTWNRSLDLALAEVTRRKIPLAWVSRCPHGNPKNTAHPKEWADWSHLSASKARVRLMLELAFKG
jgi:L-asparaginase